MNYTDDTTVFLSHPSSDAFLLALMRKFLRLVRDSGLKIGSLNVDKTCYMIICNIVKEKRIEIVSNVIKRSAKVKFLGILIDYLLSIMEEGSKNMCLWLQEC